MPIKKRKILFNSIIGLVIFLVVFIVLFITSNWVQTFVAQRVAAYLSKRVHTKVSIDKLSFDIFGNIGMENLFIEDYNKDTLLFAKYVSADIDYLSLKKQTIIFSNISFKKPLIKLQINNGKFNLTELLSYLLDTSRVDTLQNKSSWKIISRNLSIEGGRFNYLVTSGIKPFMHQIDFDNILFTNINVDADDFMITPILKFDIKKFSLKERSGFVIKDLSGKISIDNKMFTSSNLTISTNYSTINFDTLNIVSPVDSINVFSGIVNSSDMFIKLNKSKLSLLDIKYFSKLGVSTSPVFSISGKIVGKLPHFKLRNFNVLWAASSFVKVNGTIDGLPDVDNTLFYLDFAPVSTNKKGIELLVRRLSSDSSDFALPSIMNNIKYFRYKGSLSGYYNDFVVYGLLSTNLGLIKTDVKLKKTDSLNIEGHISTSNLQLDKLMKSNDTLLGNLSMNGKINGKIDSVGNFSFDVASHISSFEFNKYPYKNIDINGTFDNTSFDGEVLAKDTALKMVFLGQVDFSTNNPVFDFTADLKHIAVKTINLSSYIPFDSLSFFLKSKIYGLELSNLKGSLEIYNARFHKKEKQSRISQLILLAKTKNDSLHTISINSEVLKGEIKYNVQDINQFANIINNTIKHYYTYYNFHLSSSSKANNRFISAKISIPNPDFFNKMLFSYLSLAPHTYIEFYNNTMDSVSFNIYTDNIVYDKVRLIKPSIALMPYNKSLVFLFDTKRIYFNDFYLDSFVCDVDIYPDTANLEISWHNVADSSVYEGDLQFQTLVLDTHNVKMDFLPSYVILKDTMWYMDQWNMCFLDSVVKVNNFVLNHEYEYIAVNGNLSNKTEDTLKVKIGNIKLDHFNFLLKNTGINIKGYTNGSIYATSLLHNPIVNSNVNVSKFVFNGEKFGEFGFNTQWNDARQRLHTNIYLLRNKLKTLELLGDIYPNSQKIDMKLYVRKLLLKHLQPFLIGVLDNFRGLADGKININGSLSHPITEGILHLKKVSFKVDYLKTYYSFTAPMYINAKGAFLKDIDVYDSEGNNAKVSLGLMHNNFSSLDYDVNINTDKLLMLNTTMNDNNLFFGKVYAKSKVDINGTSSRINIKGDINTLDKTVFNLMLESPESAEELGFVTFVSHDNYSDTVTIKNEKLNTTTGLDLDLNIKTTPDALVQLIFDSKSGDIIKAEGRGDLNLTYDTLGNLSLKGLYDIEEGNYLFTLQDMINKKLEIKKGSYIKWNGDPYKAYINITAAYNLRTSLYDLTLDSNDRENVYVECLIHMKDRLDDPTITFGINIKSPNSRAQSILANMNQEEISKQIIMLMVMGHFYTPEKFRQGVEVAQDVSQTNSLGMNASELLSEQLSYWLSQITKDFDVGVKYTPGNEISRSELEVALSTQLFNNRVIVNGNVNMGGNVPTSSGVAGNVSVELKLNKKGTIRLKGFNETNDNLLLYQDSPYTQGVGIFYTESFNSLGEVFRKYYSGLTTIISKKMKILKTKIDKR